MLLWFSHGKVGRCQDNGFYNMSLVFRAYDRISLGFRSWAFFCRTQLLTKWIFEFRVESILVFNRYFMSHLDGQNVLEDKATDGGVWKTARNGLVVVGVLVGADVLSMIDSREFQDTHNEKITCGAIERGDDDPLDQNFSDRWIPPRAGEAMVPSLDPLGHRRLGELPSTDVDLVVRGCKERYSIIVTPDQVNAARMKADNLSSENP